VKHEARPKVLAFLRRGLYRSDAAKSAGITYECLRTWMREDAAFSADVKEAESASNEVLVERIRAASGDPKHWTAAAWLLERRHPAKYGRRDRVKQETTLKLEKTSTEDLKSRAVELARQLVKGDQNAAQKRQLTEGHRGEHRDGGGGGEAA